MDPVDFLSIAGMLRASAMEAERRTSVGRSYYGLYNYNMNLVLGAGQSEVAYRLAREALTAIQKTPSTP